MFSELALASFLVYATALGCKRVAKRRARNRIRAQLLAKRAASWFVSTHGRTGIGVDGDCRVIYIAQPTGAIELAGYEVLHAQVAVGYVVSVRSTHLRGAFVGGITFGRPGAIMGALSGSTRSVSKLTRIELRVTTNSPENPNHVIAFLDDPRGTGKERASMQSLEIADRWLARVNIVIGRGAVDGVQSGQATWQRQWAS